MLKYLTILLDDAAVSFCHYKINRQPRIIDKSILYKGIMFAMKENLNVNFVYPNHELPPYVHELIETISHTKIGIGDILVYDNWPKEFDENIIYVIRVDKNELMSNSLPSILPRRLNIILTDIETFSEDDFSRYKSWLEDNANKLKDKKCQVNILTDRIALDKMNNCNAGWESITLAPDGNFYICPGFYQDQMEDVGNIDDGLHIKNQHLYNIEHAPICRNCDAYHCKRCAWLNKKMTIEVNTPSHEQCVISHIERNASRILAPQLINEIEYLDPFDILQ